MLTLRNVGLSYCASKDLSKSEMFLVLVDAYSKSYSKMDQATNLADLCVVEEDLREEISNTTSEIERLKEELENAQQRREMLQQKLERLAKKKERLF